MATRDMIRHRFRRLPVVSDDVLLGIITNSDIVRYLGSGQVFQKIVTGNIAEVMSLPVRTLISGNLHTTNPGASINDATRDMLEKGIGALPVIENARLVGLVTEYDGRHHYPKGRRLRTAAYRTRLAETAYRPDPGQRPDDPRSHHHHSGNGNTGHRQPDGE
jgi:CBS domain-containing protein